MRLEGRVPPPHGLLIILKYFKANILNHLKEWWEYSEERAAIAQYSDYGVSRHEANVHAHDACVDKWIVKNEVPSTDNLCAHCSVGEQPNDPLRSYPGAALLHAGCYPTWLRSRKTEAIAGLAAIGMRPPWHDSAEGWRKYSEERAAFHQLNHGRSRCEAEAEARKDCVNTCMDLSVPSSRDDVCLHCGAGEQPNDALRPHEQPHPLFARFSLHERCYPAWIRARRTEATAFLSSKGLQPPGDIEPKAGAA